MEILIALGIFIVAFLLGGSYGWNLRERVAKKTVDEFVKQAEEFKQELKKDMIPIVVEKHDTHLFIYKKDTHEFMAQGSTMEEINDALEKRYPGKKFSCSEEHLEMIKSL